MKHVVLLLTIFIVTGCGGGGSSSSTTPPPITPPTPTPTPTFTTSPVFTALTFADPVAMLQAPGDPSRWFVVTKSGVIRVFDNDPLVVSSDEFVNITGRVDSSASESGLLGMAFHPDFANNGEVLLSYTRNGSPLESVISRFRSFDSGATLDSSSEEILLTVPQDFPNHNGGHILFGPDGYLYIGFGDGGSANDPFNRAQNNNTVLGKLLRIDVDNGSPYAIPADNPTPNASLCTQGFGGGSCPEIYASGLRNPWRFNFDNTTGQLWLGDVGQDRFEEIDVITSGGNYGWAIYEANNCNVSGGNCSPTGFEAPIHSYVRTEGTSVAGGFVYRGTTLSSLIGRYVFGDTVSGRIWALPANATTNSASEELVDSSLFISSFAEDQNGELYIVDFSTGTLHQLVEGSP